MLTRRDLIKLTGGAAIAASFPDLAQESGPDHRLVISSATLELSPRHQLRTTAYNGSAPGPLLRLKQGRTVTIEVTNQTDRPEVVHWHGLFLPTAVDGALEEGTPAIPPGASARYTFTPEPGGFRWYHTHSTALSDLSRGQYSGQHGMLMIEPRDDPGHYDREFFLTLHDWDGRLRASEDGNMNPFYSVSTVNGKVAGYGEPLRVREGERVLFHVLNSSPSEVHWISLSGHELQVIALDGNPLPRPCAVRMLRLAPAERVCALVQMNNPGVWLLGEVRRHIQAAGMGIVVEYAARSGAPQWEQPAQLQWSYEQFADGTAAASAQEAIVVPLVFESRFRGHGAMEAWTINGKSYPETATEPLVAGRLYRLQFINRSADDHPLHLHRHSFRLRSLGTPAGPRLPGPGRAVSGIVKDVVLVDAYTQTEVEFVADNPGDTLLHCHQQNHMDLGFMMLLRYA